MYVDGTPVVRVARPARTYRGDRQRFTTAHELGHLSMHRGEPATGYRGRGEGY